MAESAWWELSEADVRDLAGAVADPSSTAPMGTYVFAPDEPGALLAAQLEGAVLLEVFGNTPELLSEEYGAYAHASVFVCVIDQRRRLPAGVLRLILPSEQGLKSLVDIEAIWGQDFSALYAASGLEYDAARTWDLATLAVGPDYRSAAARGLVTIALVQTYAMMAARCDSPYAVALLHLPVLRMLQWKLRRPFLELDVEPRPYLDSPASIPVWGDLYDCHRRLEQEDPILYDIMANGTGIEAAVRPPDWDAAAAVAKEVTALAAMRLSLH